MRTKKQRSVFIELLKPGILIHSLLTFSIGYALSVPAIQISSFIIALLGMSLMSGSAASLNHIIERNYDSQMERTKARPLPANRISLTMALLYTGILCASGFVVLSVFVMFSYAVYVFLFVLDFFCEFVCFSMLFVFSIVFCAFLCFSEFV